MDNKKKVTNKTSNKPCKNEPIKFQTYHKDINPPFLFISWTSTIFKGICISHSRHCHHVFTINYIHVHLININDSHLIPSLILDSSIRIRAESRTIIGEAHSAGIKLLIRFSAIIIGSFM